MKTFIKTKLVIFIFIFFLFSKSAFGAILELSTEKMILQQREEFLVTLFLNTEGQIINTITGDINYNKELVAIESINIGGSFVSFWVEKPKVETEGVIHFSGIIPGGLSTANGEVFRIFAKTIKEGEGNFILSNTNLYLNDGKGSLIPVKNSDILIKINKELFNQVEKIKKYNDFISPEKFNITRAKSIYLFHGNSFIVFSTEDKGSGIENYQICEFPNRNCVNENSPYLLKNQTPFYRIIVRAYDIEGNVREEVLVSRWFVLLVVFISILVLFIGFKLYYRYFILNKV
jgi:hypothetical protein